MGTAFLSKQRNYALCWFVCGAFGLGSVMAAQAQIIPDDTLGSESSVVLEESVVRGAPADLIEGGAVRGPNVFHSFTDFNVTDLQRVYFANPVDIDNILSRVTGTSQSDLFGTLGVDGNANLFFLNPNGIVFGPDAQLDISGAFFASTADALEFDEGVSYSAVNPTAPPLLAITLMPGLQYGKPQQGTIQSEAQLQPGGPLTLQAETLNLQGSLLTPSYLQLWAEDTIQIRDSIAQSFIAAAGEGMDIEANEALDISILAHPDSGLFSGGDLSLRSEKPVIGDGYFWTGGQFQVQKSDGSPGDLVSLLDPVIEAQGDVSFITYSGGSLRILAGGSVNVGSLVIDGTDPAFPDEQVALSQPLQDGVSTVDVNGSTRPVVDIRAGTTAAQTPLTCSDCLSLFGLFLNPLRLQEQSPPTSADINIGIISIAQPDGVVLLTNQFQPNENLTGDITANFIATNQFLSTFITGNGGDVFIDSKGDIEILSTATTPGRIQTSTLTGDTGRIALIAGGEVTLLSDSALLGQTRGVGQGARIDILANNLRMAERAQIITGTESQEVGGDIYIEVTDSLELIGDIPSSNMLGARNTAILSTVRAGGTADSGDITIKAGSLVITDGATVGAFVRAAEGGLAAGQGDSGNINVIIEGDILIDSFDSNANAGLDTGLAEGTVGNSGDIRIEAQNLSIQDANAPAIRTDVLGIGDSGDIEIKLEESLVVSGDSIIATDLREGGIGNAGDIIVNAQDIVVENGAQLRSTVASGNRGLPGGQGIGGDILLTGRDSITLSQGILESTTGEGAVGAAGDIVLDTPNLIIENSSFAVTATFNESPGGDIQVIAGQVNLEGSNFLSEAIGPGPAGNIGLTADDSLTVSAGNISASADAAGGGDIDINAGIAFFNQGSLLSTSVFDSNGGGGDITINANALILIEDSDILANAELGPGGTIDINTKAFLAALFNSGRATPVGRNPGSFSPFRGNNRVDISADSAIGEDGSVFLSNLVTDEGLNELPIDPIDPTDLIDQSCALLASQQSQEDSQATNARINRFTIVGRGGLPLTPEQDLEAIQLLEDLGPQEILSTTENTNADMVTTVPTETSSKRIVEPIGWRRAEDGRLYLYSSTSVFENATTPLARHCVESSSTNTSSVSSR